MFARTTRLVLIYCRLVRSSTHFGKRDNLKLFDSIMTMKTQVGGKQSQFIVLQSVQIFCSGLKNKNEIYKICNCFVMILKKKRIFQIQDTEFLQVSIFSILRFAKFAKFTVKTTTAELVKFYSLNTENKEHHILRIKMLTKIIMTIFQLQFIQLVENQHILINSYLFFWVILWTCSFSCVEKMWKTKFSGFGFLRIE